MARPVNERVQKRRAALRAEGLRPVQIWVPDNRSAAFKAEARRQSLRTAQAEAQDEGLQAFINAVVDDALRAGK